MPKLLSTNALLVCCLSLLSGSRTTQAFVFSNTNSVRTATTSSSSSSFGTATSVLESKQTSLLATPNDDSKHDSSSSSLLSRRSLFTQSTAASALLLIATTAASPQPARATYSAYTNREKDWQERTSNNQVDYKSAKQLRSELREIVPQNTEGSRVFCPNGQPSSVSPMMENKCGDALAMPSVYGRSQDVVGNSIPGFKQSFTGTSNMVGVDTSGASSLSGMSGGFPKY